MLLFMLFVVLVVRWSGSGSSRVAGLRAGAVQLLESDEVVRSVGLEYDGERGYIGGNRSRRRPAQRLPLGLERQRPVRGYQSTCRSDERDPRREVPADAERRSRLRLWGSRPGSERVKRHPRLVCAPLIDG